MTRLVVALLLLALVLRRRRADRQVRVAAKRLYDRLERAAHGSPMREDIEALGDALAVDRDVWPEGVGTW